MLTRLASLSFGELTALMTQLGNAGLRLEHVKEILKNPAHLEHAVRVIASEPQETVWSATYKITMSYRQWTSLIDPGMDLGCNVQIYFPEVGAEVGIRLHDDPEGESHLRLTREWTSQGQARLPLGLRLRRLSPTWLEYKIAQD